MTEDELNQLLAWARSLPEHTCERVPTTPWGDEVCPVCEDTVPWAQTRRHVMGDPASQAAWQAFVTVPQRVVVKGPAEGFGTSGQLR